MVQSVVQIEAVALGKPRQSLPRSAESGMTVLVTSEVSHAARWPLENFPQVVRREMPTGPMDRSGPLPAADRPPPGVTVTRSTDASLLTTGLFWICLLLATGLYALVTLAPKFVAYYDLLARHHRQQVDLVALEAQARVLKETAQALEQDPHLAAELSRREFDIVDPREQRIAVEGDLAFELGQSVPRPASSPPALPVWLPALAFLASMPSLQNIALALAAGLVVVSFTFFREPVSLAAPDRAPVTEPIPASIPREVTG